MKLPVVLAGLSAGVWAAAIGSTYLDPPNTHRLSHTVRSALFQRPAEVPAKSRSFESDRAGVEAGPPSKPSGIGTGNEKAET